MNTKGRTDTEVFAQLLSPYIECLYPNARDQVGYHVFLKIEGGPDRLDLNSLAELRSRGVCTDEMFQKMEFKELLSRHKKALLAEYSVLERRRALKKKESRHS